MAFPQTKTPLSLTVRKRQRRKSSAVPLLLPVQSPAPQCASNNARPVITGACRSRLLGRIHRPFSRKARRGSSHGRPALPCTIRQLSAAFFPGTLSRHSRIFHCPGVYSPARGKSSDAARLIFHLVCLRSESISDKGSAGVCGRRSAGKAEEAALSARRTSDIPESSFLRLILQLFLPKSGKDAAKIFLLCLRLPVGHSFIRCCLWLNFIRCFVELFGFFFTIRLFTAPSVSPDMQNTPPNFGNLAVYFEAKRWYINFVRTFCGHEPAFMQPFQSGVTILIERRLVCFGIIVLWNVFIIPRAVRIHPLALPRILHLTDGTKNCGSSQMFPLTRCGSFAWPRAVPRASSIRLS